MNLDDLDTLRQLDAENMLAEIDNLPDQLGQAYQLPVHLFHAVLASNNEHKTWACRRLAEIFTDLQDKTIAVWGLTYKPGTDTLRRSTAVELCRWLVEKGARVHAHDPVVKQLSADLAGVVELFSTPLEAVRGADALVVATEWQDYLAISAREVIDQTQTAWVIDANRFLGKTLGMDPGIRYLSVGKVS